MTEAEWLACEDPQAMLELLRSKVSDRKLRLFTVACCRTFLGSDLLRIMERFADGVAAPDEFGRDWFSAWDKLHMPIASWTDDEIRMRHIGEALLGDPGRAALLAGQAAVQEDVLRPRLEALRFSAVNQEQRRVMRANRTEAWDTAWAAAVAAGQAIRAACIGRGLQDARAEEVTRQVNLLRDVYGNPFCSASINPSCLAWNNGTVPNLALAIYDDRAFDRMPILADALEDASCTSQEILEHCRGPAPHSRGCWVVDLLLGKE